MRTIELGGKTRGSRKRGLDWKAGLALVLAFTLFATQVPAAVVQVQTATGVTNGGLSVSATYPATPAAGNLLVAVAGNYNGSASPTVPPGWITAKYGSSHTPGQSIYYKIAGASEPTVVTISDYPLGFDTRLGLHIYEYSGIDAGDPLDVTNMVDGFGTSISPGGVTTTASSSLIIAAFITNVSTSALSWTDSFLEQNDFTNGGQPASQATYAGAHLITGSAGTYTTTATTDADGNWRAQIVAFNAVPPPVTEYVVTNTNDSGAGSLRAAIDYANLNAGTTISFDIPDTDLGYQTDGTDHWWRITPAVGLPAITESGTTIDGSTQTTNRGDTNTRGPEIELNGATAGTADGLTVSAAAGVVIKDLIIDSFTGQGVQFNGVGTVGGGVYGCYLGTDAVGEADLGNTNYGIWVTNGASDLDIGGPGAGEGNLISGNTQGVVVDSGSLIRILGNKIGTDRTGTVAISQGQGILISGTVTSVTIGGSVAGAGNLVSGNGSQISVEDSASSVVILGNIIGTDPSGTIDLSNGRGIELDVAADPSGIDVGGFLPGEGNLIAYNTTGIMVWWNGGGHRIRGNTIRNSSGGGLTLYAPDVEVTGNLIHDNGSKGIYIATGATGTMVLNNTIHGHDSSGVEIATDGEAALHNNVITGSNTYGLFMSGGTLSSESYNLVTDNLTNPPNTTRCNVALDATDLNADPLYADAAGGDFSLTECTSPAINAGLDFGGAQPDLNGTEPGNYNGVAPDMGALESGCSSIGASISGQIFEDADFTGTASEYDGGAGDLALANVDVELYDAANGYLGSTTTDATGNYSFPGLTDGTYKIRVRSATLGDADTPPAGGLNASVGVTWPYPLPEMTWANGAALYGGQVATTDDTDTGDNLGPGDTWVAVVVSGANASGVNLGFAYNLIVNTADDGLADATRSAQGSLRQFLKNANAIGAGGATTANSSQFHMQVAANQSDGADSWWRITPVAVLPSLADPGIDLDGATQTINGGDSNTRGPEVEIDGATLPTVYGLTLTSASHTLNGLVVNGFASAPGTGIVVDGAAATGVVITGCYVGTNAVGEAEIPNAYGILLANGAAGTVIGGAGVGEGNVISGQNFYGIELDTAGAGTSIQGNRIGTNATGDAAMPNAQGIYIDGGTAILIGGPGVGEGNLISGNINYGMNLQFGDDVTIQGNWMGLNLAGTDPLPDGGTAVYGWSVDNVKVGGSGPGEGNIIAGNDSFGISLGPGCQKWVIQGNNIGVGPLGTETNLGNTGAGNIRVSPNDITIDATIGGINPGEGNLIAYASGPGITCVSIGAAVEIIGNVIRNNAEEGITARIDSLTVAMNLIYDNGAGFDGIMIQDVASDGKIYQNTIHNSGGDGIEVVGIGHEIRNNIITGSAGYGINVNAGTMTESNNLITGAATSPANALGRSNVALDAGDLDADPQYVDDAGGDFSLAECTSPAINVGLDLGVDQPDLNGAAAGNYNGPLPDMGALESGCVAASTNLTGRVFEDIAGDVLFDGSIGDANNPGVENVDVYLYLDDGDAGLDAGDTLIGGAPTQTDASGNYSFTGLADGDYFVVVDSKTVGSTQDPAAVQADIWAEQTYGPVGAYYDNGIGYGIRVSAGPCYGGIAGHLSDDFSQWDDREHRAIITVGGSGVSNVDFGFSFNVVTNLVGGDARDDDVGANRTIQGSLRQFIQNANAINAPNPMRFVPAESPGAVDGLGNSWWRLMVTVLLPAITGDGTTIDGSAFDHLDGTTPLNPNAAQIGAGLPVGTQGTYTTPKLDPELEIRNFRGTAVLPTGLVFEANDSVLRHVSIWGFGDSASSFDANVLFGTNFSTTPDFTGSLVEFSVIGTGPAAFTEPGGADLSGQKNLTMRETDNAIIRDNLIGFAGGLGVDFNSASNSGLVLRNEFRRNGILDSMANPVSVWISGNVTGNLITDNASGIYSAPTPGVSYQDNTITTNGWGGSRPNAIQVSGSSVTIQRNVIADNAGAGVVVNSTTTGTQVSRNSIHGNGTVTGQIGIDLLASGDDPIAGPFVTVNDDGDADAGGNGLLNYPVLETARLQGADLIVTGWARPASQIEFYVAAPDPLGFGEGETWLITKTEGAGDDTDATTTTYGPGAVNGIVQGTDTTNRFSFTIPLASLAAPVVVSDELTALAILGGNTSEFGGYVAVGGFTISGTVFEDTDFAGTASNWDNGVNDLGLDNVDVELYDGLDAYVTSVTTAAGGAYTFTGLSNDTYKVRVRSATIGDADTPPAGGLHPTVPATWPYPLADMTWGNGVAAIGGQDTGGDDTATADNAGPGDTWVAVTVSGGDVSGVNFGFCYDLIVNEDDDANTDNLRSKQGTLRQFIKNSNAIVGVNKSWFQIPSL